MRKSTKKRLKRFITERTAYWCEVLGITDDVRPIFVTGEYDAAEVGEHRIAAITKANWEYHWAEIVWYLYPCARLSDKDLEDTLVHELVHVLLDPMESHVEDHSEQCEFVVQNVTRALLKAHYAR